MGIISRFTEIMSANISSILEKAETANADVLLEKYLKDARLDLDELKGETASIIADEMAAGRKVAALEKEMDSLARFAEQAVAAGNDGDAVRFLEAKATVSTEKVQADEMYAKAKINSDRMRELTKKLLSDINAAESKLRELKTKMAVAEQAEKMEERDARYASYGSGLAKFDNLVDAVERRIDEVEAKKDINAQLADAENLTGLKEKYSTSEAAAQKAESVSAELAAIKAKLGV